MYKSWIMKFLLINVLYKKFEYVQVLFETCYVQEFVYVQAMIVKCYVNSWFLYNL